MDEPLVVDYFTRLVNGILMLDVHWGEKQFWDELCVTEGVGGCNSHTSCPSRPVHGVGQDPWRRPCVLSNSMALYTSAIRCYSGRSSNGQCNPWVKISFILGQIGWCQNSGSMVEIFQNSDPVPRGELLLALSARWRLPLCFFIRIM
jgi:hypothetical protein